MAHLRYVARTHRRTLMKTGSYYVMHMAVAAIVVYAVTGDVWAAMTLSLLEPAVQAVAYFFHERAWTAQDMATPIADPITAPVVGGSVSA